MNRIGSHGDVDRNGNASLPCLSEDADVRVGKSLSAIHDRLSESLAKPDAFRCPGVDGAIHRKGGGRILAECQKIRETEYPKGLPTGKAVITGGGDLPARRVIRTVGPIYGLNNGRDAELLADCYRNCLALAAAEGLKTVSFPSISTGAFGYPKDEAAMVSSGAISEFLRSDSSISQVRLVFFSASDTENFVQYCGFSG